MKLFRFRYLLVCLCVSSFILLPSSLQSGYQPRAGLPYKVYTALLTQSGTDAPVATVLQNTLGADITWGYQSVGEYTASPSIEFTDLNKVSVTCGRETNSGTARDCFMRRSTSNGSSLSIKSGAGGGSLADDILAGTTINIRVYP